MKTLTEIKSDLKNFIPQGIDLTLQAMKATIAEGTDTFNELLLLEARYEEVRKQLIQGILEDDKAQIEFNRIRKDLLAMIDGLQENHLVQSGGADQDGKPDVYNGEVLYRIPRQMQMAEEVKCLVRIAFDRKILIEDLELEEEDVMKDIRISDVMGVELLDPGDQAFEVRTIHDTVQFVEKDLYTEWVFWVKPVLEGKHPLVLKISIIEMRNGIERKRNVVLEETVEILAGKPEPAASDEFMHSGVALNLAGTSGEPGPPAGGGRGVQPLAPSPTHTYQPVAPKRSGNFRKMASALAALAVFLTAWAIWNSTNIDPVNVGELSEAEKTWKDIKDNPSRENFQEFVKKYPDDELAELALRKLDSLEQADWESALASRSVEKLRDYVRQYPTGRNVPEALSIIEEVELAIEENNNITKPVPTRPETERHIQEPAGPSGRDDLLQRPGDRQDAPRPANPGTIDISGDKEPISMRSAGRLPIYPGCDNSDRAKEEACTNRSIGKFIKEHLEYPEEAKRKRIEGTVVVEFIVEKDGTISSVQYNNDIGGGCAKEAVRLVRRLPDFVPGRNRSGNPARIIYRLPIRFELR